eukprot:TRINITY_DN826_c0_g1_i48.p2 TRINITY_DN826_c0_g1~~TRINITY_DN826_c0_g1_i48.p2  ORF type:complete len:118 (+),score=2.65 TRINITY_DN826_c0_g1_i48:279-632(+)
MSSLRLAIAAFLLIWSITRAVWDLVSLGLGSELSSVRCKHSLLSSAIKSLFLLLLFDHTGSLGLGSELSSVRGEHSLAIKLIGLVQLLDHLHGLGLCRSLGLGSELSSIGCENVLAL